MRIDEKRHLVMPVVTERIIKKVDGKDVAEDVVRIYAYHSPVSREVFESNFRVLAATKSALSNKGAHYIWSSAPRIAALTLKDEGRKEAAARGSFDGDGNVKDDETTAFLAELKRLTMILCPSANGWESLPVDMAISQGKVDIEDWEEALSGIVFFTCAYAMARKADRETTAKAYASPLNAWITSSTPTELGASLPSLTQVEPTAPAQFLTPSFPT